MESMLFEVEGLSKRFGGIVALADVSFHVRAGEMLGLIGPNGAGKSTLFECLAGVLPCDRGSLRSGGRPVNAPERRSLLFYVPDGIAPWPSQAVRWALDFTIGFLGGRASLREEVIRQLDLGPLLQRPIGALSKGQRKRVLLGIGLLTAQPTLLIDEPFEGLDLRQARDVAAAFRTHAALGRTLFLSIHQIGDAARYCDRFVLLSGGRVCGEGTVPELAARAGLGNIAGAAVGSAANNAASNAVGSPVGSPASTHAVDAAGNPASSPALSPPSSPASSPAVDAVVDAAGNSVSLEEVFLALT
jgi:ABC-type multidrug transport system ATPase subunit